VDGKRKTLIPSQMMMALASSFGQIDARSPSLLPFSPCPFYSPTHSLLFPHQFFPLFFSLLFSLPFLSIEGQAAVANRSSSLSANHTPFLV
jgi:hypothetical protein